MIDTYADHATYISVLVFFAISSGCCLRLVVLGLNDFDSLFLLGIAFGQRDFLLGDYNVALAIRSLVVVSSCTLFLLLCLSG